MIGNAAAKKHTELKHSGVKPQGMETQRSEPLWIGNATAKNHSEWKHSGVKPLGSNAAGPTGHAFTENSHRSNVKGGKIAVFFVYMRQQPPPLLPRHRAASPPPPSCKPRTAGNLMWPPLGQIIGASSLKHTGAQVDAPSLNLKKRKTTFLPREPAIRMEPVFIRMDGWMLCKIKRK